MNDEFDKADFIKDYTECVLHITAVQSGNYNYDVVKKYVDDTIEKYKYKLETINYYTNQVDARTFLPINDVLKMIFDMLTQYGCVKFGEEEMKKIKNGVYKNE